MRPRDISSFVYGNKTGLTCTYRIYSCCDVVVRLINLSDAFYYYALLIFIDLLLYIIFNLMAIILDIDLSVDIMSCT